MENISIELGDFLWYWLQHETYYKLNTRIYNELMFMRLKLNNVRFRL